MGKIPSVSISDVELISLQTGEAEDEDEDELCPLFEAGSKFRKRYLATSVTRFGEFSPI